MKLNKIYQGHTLDVLKTFPDNFVNTVITSPPYWGLRDYGIPPSDWPEVTYKPMPGMPEITVPAWTGCLGLEPTPEMFAAHVIIVFREVWRVLRDDGTLWINFGDSYWANRSHNGLVYTNKTGKSETYMLRSGGKHEDLKPKDLIGIPWRVALALQADGWYLRSDIVWSKPNSMPESVTDRPTKAHEYIFLLSKAERYYYDNEAIKEAAVSGDPNPPRGREGVTTNLNKGQRQGENGELSFRETRSMRNKRSVWSVTTKPLKEAHFATFPVDLIEPCVLAGSPKNGVVLDPFIGSGTTGLVSLKHGRDFVGVELNTDYIKIAEKRLRHVQLELV